MKNCVDHKFTSWECKELFFFLILFFFFFFALVSGMSSIFCFLLESSRIPRCQMCTEFVFFGLLITNVLPDQIQSAHGFLNSRGPGCFVRRAVFARDALMSKITVCLIPIYIFSCLFFFCFLSYLSSFCTRETKDVFIMKLF